MKLNHTITGDAPGVPVVLVHGLFGQGRNLGALARRLAQGRRVVTVDLRNHGESPWDADHSYPAVAADLSELIEDLGGPVDLAGHSMGGKTSMVVALTRPELIRKLAIMDIAPVTYRHSQTAYIDAMEALDLSTIDRRSAADRALAQHIDEPGIRAFLLQSLDLKAEPPAWRLNLPVLRARMSDLVGWPDNLPEATFTGPVIELMGDMSNYVTADGEAALRRYFPQIRFVRVKKAGHWLHADAPEIVAEALAGFFGEG